jgi:LGFP repeat/Prokaryotic phospholipase A2
LQFLRGRTTARHYRAAVALLTAIVIAALLVTPSRGEAAGRVFAGLALTADGQGYSLTATSGEKYAFGTASAQPNPSGFSGRIVDVALTSDGRGTMAVSSTGQFYAYGTARPQPNPSGFTGRIVDVALTADGQGAMAVSSTGQFYAYGTARPQQNPSDFSGRIVDVALTADGRGAAALSSIGQVYAYGSVTYRGNGDHGCTRYGGADVCLEIRAKYEILGGPRGFLGIPTSEEFSAGGGRGLGLHFQGGSIYWSPSTGAHEVRGAIRDRWATANWENGFLGFPISDEFSAGGGRGRGSHFQNGSIYWSPSTGAHEVHGAIREEWGRLGWEHNLGFPVTDEHASFEGADRASFFDNGAIYWSAARGAKGFRLPYHTNTNQEALTILRLPLPEFLSLRAVRSAFDPGSGLEVLNWTNDGCSGPTYQDVESFFRDACLRHDFGWRNFGPKGLGLDATQARKNEIDTALHADALAICAQRGQPQVRFLVGSIKTVSCKLAADSVYLAVSRWPWAAPI